MGYENWKLSDKEALKKYFERSIEIFGRARILTSLVYKSGDAWRISAFVPLLDATGKPIIVCIARAYKVRHPCMDAGYQLALELYHTAYEYGQEGRRYQDTFEHSWL